MIENKTDKARYLKDITEVVIDLDDTLVFTSEKYKLADKMIAMFINEHNDGQIPIEAIISKQKDKQAKYVSVLNWYEAFKQAWRDTYLEMDSNSTYSNMVHIEDSILHVITNPVRLKPDATKFLHYLKSTGRNITLLTSGSKFIQEKVIERACLSSYFTDVVVARYTKHYELEELKRNKNLKEIGVVIGNSLQFDISPAVKLGIRSVFIPEDNSFNIKDTPHWTLMTDKAIMCKDIEELNNLFMFAVDISREN